MVKDKTDKDIVLKIDNVGKDYILGAVTSDTLKDAIKYRRMKRQGKTFDGELHNKVYTALDGVSLEVKKGECIGIIGSNGAGKSTLLKLISRITTPTRGAIYIDGKVASMLEVGTGFHPELTGRENIYLNGSILGMSKKEIEEKIESIIDFSEVREFIDTPVKRYSSGMYVKLAFSVSAHLDSDIMIMDEVLAVGDIQFQHKCLKKMKEIAKSEGRTVLYVSHNMDTVRNLCDRCIVLDKGHLLFDGSVEEATKLYNGNDFKTETTIDLSKFIRPGWLGRDDIRLDWAEYRGRQNNTVDGDSVSIFMKYSILKPVKNVGIRVELFEDEAKPFATQMFKNIISGEVGESGEVTLDLDVSKIENGTYHTFYTLYTLDPYDTGIDMDCVQGLDIIINREHKPGTLKWRGSSWGNVRL
ncbi:MAG: ABC transporter ATP-binding protein [Pseudobutyrivibrio sp.]|nr:ABC transporter ATP-binding protein [Pseudobutyrivibrio sp.]